MKKEITAKKMENVARETIKVLKTIIPDLVDCTGLTKELENTQRQLVIERFCKNCVYYFTLDGCQNINNKTGDVIAECPYYQRIVRLNPDE